MGQTHCLAGHGLCCFVDRFVKFDIQGEVAGDVGVEVCEVLDYLECEVTDGDAWGAANVLGRDDGLLYANGHAKLSSRMGEAVDESLKCLLGVSCQSYVMCEDHLAYDNRSYFGLGTKAGQVEETAIVSGLKIHSVLWLAEGIGQQQREKDAEESLSEHATLLHAALHWEGVRGGSIVLDGVLHVFIKIKR